ncbi:P-type ATPase (P-ATPase) Superfamily [Thraustotheca clavata]|uniref:P-type ATPase (P-ATPase) Superfamily n=1 Tax=Thraustotheca clavata TaxID=74557 RepID=A0A1V9Y4G5_9STRA|nr:P-type ATPase (P-ATPase) Superfamily [Thraustotheca clavata]
MSCAMNCGKKVETALQEANGVKSANVDFSRKLAVITVEPGSRITENDLVGTVEGIKGKRFTAYVVDANGDEVATRTPSSGSAMSSPLPVKTTTSASSDTGDVTLTIVGMTCNSCANSVETALRQTDGVVSAIVNFATESAYVKFTKNTIGIRSLVEVVEGIGYEASVATGFTTAASNENRIVEIAAWKRRLYISVFFTFPIVMIMTVLDNILQIRSGLQSPAFGIPGKSKLLDDVTALDLSRTIYRRIQMNFVWALGYNLVLLPLSAGVLYAWSIDIPQCSQVPPWLFPVFLL